jgi:hypothetical protein
MIQSPRITRGDLVKIGLDYRICVCSDDSSAVLFHCNHVGTGVRVYDALVIDPILGRYSKKVKMIKHLDATTTAMRINQP